MYVLQVVGYIYDPMYKRFHDILLRVNVPNIYVGKFSVHQSGLAPLAVLIYPGNHMCCRKYLCITLHQLPSP